jgi:hypothetical protein
VKDLLASARGREIAWDAERHARVRTGIERTHGERRRRARTVSVVLSSLAGATLFVLAVRAFASSPDGTGTSGMEARLPPPQASYADGGFRGDATLRD